MFFSCIYIKVWITAPLAVKAAYTDLCLLKSLSEYKTSNKKIFLLQLIRHLWYLSEELVGLGLFDDDVMQNVKEEIVQAMLALEKKDVRAKNGHHTIGKSR